MSYVKESDSLATISPKSETCGSLQLWNATNGYLIRALPLYMERKGSEEWGILTHPVSGQIVVTRGFEMKVWKPLPTLGELAIKLPLHVVGFSNKPGFVLQSSFANPRDSRTALELRLLNLREMPPTTLAGQSFPGGPDRRVSISKNGIAACVKEGPLLRIYEIQDDGQISEVSAVKISPLQMNLALISPSGHRLWCWDGVFDARSGELLVPLNHKGIMDGTGYLAGHWLNSSRVLEIVQMQTAETPNKKTNLGRTLLLWNTETGVIAAKSVPPKPFPYRHRRTVPS